MGQFSRVKKRARLGPLPFHRKKEDYDFVRDILKDNPGLSKAADRVLKNPLAPGTVKIYEYAYFEFADFCEGGV